MFEGDYELDLSEEDQIENPANIYSIVRTLEFIEWAFSTGHISREIYIQETNIILDQYNNCIDAYKDNFPGIDFFAQKNGLTEFKLGINRIKQGPVQISNTNQLGLIVNLTQKFNDIYNLFIMRGDAPSMEMTISDVLLYFNDLCYIISQCKNILNNELEEIKRLFNWNNFLKSKKAIDKISLEDEKQLKFDISQAYDKVTKLLNK